MGVSGCKFTFSFKPIYGGRAIGEESTTQSSANAAHATQTQHDECQRCQNGEWPELYPLRREQRRHATGETRHPQRGVVVVADWRKVHVDSSGGYRRGWLVARDSARWRAESGVTSRVSTPRSSSRWLHSSGSSEMSCKEVRKMLRSPSSTMTCWKIATRVSRAFALSRRNSGFR